MAKIKIAKIEMAKIYVDEILNIKEINDSYYNKMFQQIEENGQLIPILVNYHPEEDKYSILDGKIRYNIFKKLKYDQLVCSVIEVSEKEERLICLQLHEDFDIDVLRTGKLINLVDVDYGVEHMEKYLNFGLKQLKMYSSIYSWNWDLYEAEGTPEEFGGQKEETKKEIKIKKLF